MMIVNEGKEIEKKEVLREIKRREKEKMKNKECEGKEEI